MKGALYWIGNDNGKRVIQQTIWDDERYDDQYSSEDTLKKYIMQSPFFLEFTSKRVWEQYIFDNAFNRMKVAYENDNLAYILNCLSVNDNVQSRKAFEIIANISLPKTARERMTVLKNFLGQKYIDYQNKLKQEEQAKLAEEAKKKQAEFEKMEQAFIAGEYVNGENFAKLCDKYGIKLAIRTRGFCQNKIERVRIDGSYRLYGRGKSQGFFDAFLALKKKILDK